MTHHAQRNLLTLVASKAKARRFSEVPFRLTGFGPPEFADEFDDFEAEREREAFAVERHVDERQQEGWA